ncbi:MAG: hypothetical protein Alpg2KO_33370 [Alphaproteobacteria bacterium]
MQDQHGKQQKDDDKHHWINRGQIKGHGTLRAGDCTITLLAASGQGKEHMANICLCLWGA